MAGGEFRFGTDSIYMARHQHRPPESTSAKIWITWLHYGCVSGPIASLFNTIAVFRRGKLGIACACSAAAGLSTSAHDQTQVGRLSIRLSVAPPVPMPAGTSRNPLDRPAAPVRRPWLTAPAGDRLRRKTLAAAPTH